MKVPWYRGFPRYCDEQIFEAFERESSSISSKTPGSGLGMAITKGLIDLMGGEIKVKSK